MTLIHERWLALNLSFHLYEYSVLSQIDHLSFNFGKKFRERVRSYFRKLVDSHIADPAVGIIGRRCRHKTVIIPGLPIGGGEDNMGHSLSLQ